MLKGYGEYELAFKPRSLGYQLKIADLFVIGSALLILAQKRLR